MIEKAMINHNVLSICYMFIQWHLKEFCMKRYYLQIIEKIAINSITMLELFKC